MLNIDVSTLEFLTNSTHLMAYQSKLQGIIMNKDWPTKAKDMHIAQLIMEEYANKQHTDSLGLFELVVVQSEKRMDFRLSNWVLALAEQFNTMYGASQGDFITRQVISFCMIQGQTLH